MPQEKPPRRHVFWWTVGHALSHCGFLVAYLVNGILAVVAGSMLFLLFARDVPVPQFVVQALQANLATEGLSQHIGSIQFDSGGRILLNDIRLYSGDYEQPLVRIDHALVGLDLPAMLFGNIRASSLSISNGRLLSPSAVSPSGLPGEVLSGLSGAVQLAAGRVQIEHLRFRAGQVRALVTGSVQLPTRDQSRPDHDQPGLSAAIGQLVAQIPLIIRIEDSMTGLEEPVVRIHLAPNRTGGYDATVHLMADGYSASPGPDIRGVDARIELVTHLGRIATIKTRGQVEAAVQEDMAEVTSLAFRADWTKLPTREAPYPEQLEVNLAGVSSHGANLRHTTLIARQGDDDNISFHGSTVLGRQPICLEGQVHPGEGRAALGVSGRAGADWLELGSEIIGSDLTHYADLSRKPIYRLGVDLGPEWAWSEVRFEAMASDFLARGVLLDTAYAHGSVTPSGVHVDQIVVRQGKTRASMAYTDTFATRDYRFKIRGTTRPVAISGWFGPWWENFWKDFDIPAEGGRCDLNIFGNWFGIRKTLVTGSVEASNIAVKSIRFDHLLGLIFIRPHYFDIYQASAERPEGGISGEFQLQYEPGNRLPIEQHFQAQSSIDLKAAARIFGDGGITMLAPYDYDIPPGVEFTGTVLRTGEIWDTDIALQIDTDHPFRYEEFPLDSLKSKVRILNKRVELPEIEATYAGGTLAGEALVDEQGILSFDATLENAGFQEAITIFGEYLKRNDPPGNAETKAGGFEDKNPGGLLDLTMKAKGTLGDFSSYTGIGRFGITEAELGRIHLFGVLSQALQSTLFKFSTLRFTEASSEILINRNEIYFPDLSVFGPLAAIKSVGSYDIPSGNLDFQARFFPFNRGSFPVFALLDTMLHPFSSFFEIKMTGSMTSPKMSVSLGGADSSRPFATEPASEAPTEETDGTPESAE
ncbi:MAG: hypothetical protein DRP71_14445 [Verrucomicrobia bacterium]|nr:MAG: hypothetical protein DRP71_14445 [Verrucomicrobiota bacterium]